MQPTVMLFDEPTSALDVEMIKEVLDVIRELAEQGMSICIVTHEMRFARTVATQVCFMDEGRMIERARPSDFFENPKSSRLRKFLDQVS
jgi:ABC-type polar amino acid transport system ATPase subunit